MLALPPHLRDDRFDPPWEETIEKHSWSCVALTGGQSASLVVGTKAGGALTVELLFDPSIGGMEEIVAAQVAEVVASGVSSIEFWAKPAPEWLAPILADNGFSPYRGLYQMRRPLPVEIEAIQTRSYRDSDREELRLVNNASFAAHPDQGNQTPDQWNDTIDAPWFRADGTRILTDESGEIVGFCITKIHPDQGLGEIYVIGLHPRVHGRGLGAPMTAAGLDWLHSQGIETAMLYVEDDNFPAVKTYAKLGFATVRHDRAWTLTPT